MAHSAVVKTAEFQICQHSFSKSVHALHACSNAFKLIVLCVHVCVVCFFSSCTLTFNSLVASLHNKYVFETIKQSYDQFLAGNLAFFTFARHPFSSNDVDIHSVPTFASSPIFPLI